MCLGLYELTGVEFPARNLREWQYVREPERAFANHPLLDMAEFDAVTRCVDAFVLYRPQKSLRVHVPWCENDYQIDVAKPEGRAEWKRILDQCAAVGVEHSLFTPANSDVAPLKDNADAWGWECCLWLGLGQKIRKGEWNIASDPIPPSIQEILDYAKSKNVKLVAYAYPTLGWKQNPEWTAWCGGKTGGYIGADTGVRSFQDWFVEQLVAFQKRTGISGYSFDHWWIAYEPTKEGFKPTSKYAQWYGCRRILEELRRRSRTWWWTAASSTSGSARGRGWAARTRIRTTDDDLLATWRGPHRLLLYVHIADPDDKWTVGLTLNGQPVELKKAYGDVIRSAANGPSPASTPTCRA